MSLALEDAYPDGVRHEPLPLRYYSDLDSATHAHLRVSVTILTSGESVGSTVAVYTDGSFSPENGLSGGGMVAYRCEEELHASSYLLGYLSSSFEAEMYTIHRAIDEIINLSDSLNLAHDVEFRTDSMSFLSFVSQPYKPNAPYHFLCFWDLVGTFVKNTGLAIHFSWVKAHAGNKGNERADSLANLGRGSTENPPRRLEPAPLVSDRGEIRKRLLGNPNNPDSHFAESTNDEPFKKRKVALSNIDRNDQVTIFQLLSGRSPITADHLHTIGQVDDARCPGCENADDSIKHLILECPAYAFQRARYFDPDANLGVLSTAPSFVLEFLRKIERSSSRETIALIRKRNELN